MKYQIHWALNFWIFWIYGQKLKIIKINGPWTPFKAYYLLWIWYTSRVDYLDRRPAAVYPWADHLPGHPLLHGGVGPLGHQVLHRPPRHPSRRPSCCLTRYKRGVSSCRTDPFPTLSVFSSAQDVSPIPWPQNTGCSKRIARFEGHAYFLNDECKSLHKLLRIHS